MKLLRLDHIAQTSADCELHPQLTILRGVSAQTRSSLIDLFRSIGDGGTLSFGGLIEVNGVQLALDRATIEGLQLDGSPSGVINWSNADPTGGPTGQDHSVSVQWVPGPGRNLSLGRELSLSELDEARHRLRSVAADRKALAETMSKVRDRLDSFAHAALEVCVGQIDALEARRSLLRTDWQNDRSSREDLATRLHADVKTLEAECQAVRSLDLTELGHERERLADLLVVPSGPDPACVELALRIDNSMRRLRDQSGRHASVTLKLRETEQRLSEAVAISAAADRSMLRRTFDPHDVQELERVRDELFASDDRHSRLSVNRNRRKMAELRGAEAELLERLGFDTYSSYVMGIPSMQAALEQSSARDEARLHVEQIEEELSQLSSDSPSEQALAASESELMGLLEKASVVLGSDRPDVEMRLTNLGSSSFEPTNTPTADYVADVITELKGRQLRGPDEADPAVVDAADSLRRAVLRVAPPDTQAGQVQPRAVAGSVIDDLAWRGTPTQLLAGVDRWITSLNGSAEWLAEAGRSLHELKRRIDELSDPEVSPDGVTEWAEVEAELDALLDRLAAAQERVRRHDEAMVEIAELRDIELCLRADERSLLERIAQLEEQLRVTPDSPSNVDSTDPEPEARWTESSARTRTEASPLVSQNDTQLDPDPEWALLSSLARRRSVSFVGSLPQLIIGSPGVSQNREAVFRRILRFSDLVQMIVISDDEWVCSWADSLGRAVKVVDC